MELNKCSRCGAFHTNSGDVCPKCAARSVIAYEPVWAIGTGKTATADQATQTGIAQKNVTRFADYQGIAAVETEKQDIVNPGVVFN